MSAPRARYHGCRGGGVPNDEKEIEHAHEHVDYLVMVPARPEAPLLTRLAFLARDDGVPYVLVLVPALRSGRRRRHRIKILLEACSRRRPHS
jgi:hypothetical protein